MLEPFAALSTASAVLQILDFASKLLSSGYELYNRGSILSYEDIEIVTRDFKDVHRVLCDNIASFSETSSLENAEIVSMVVFKS